MSGRDPDPEDVVVPPESKLLKKAYKASRLTASDLAIAAGISRSSVHLALDGHRSRGGVKRAVIPPDDVLVDLASALHVSPDQLRDCGRDHAAVLLEGRGAAPEESGDRAARWRAEGRAQMAAQVLATFSSPELAAELQRRADRTDDAEAGRLLDDVLTGLQDRADLEDLAQTTRTETWPL